MTKVKRLTLDRYEHGLLVRALYEAWKHMLKAGADTTTIENLILRVIEASSSKAGERRKKDVHGSALLCGLR